MITLERARPFVRRHRDALFVVKVGGACLSRPDILAGVASQLATIDALGARLVVVHGAGPQTDILQREAGEEPVKFGGRRVTTPVALAALRRAALDVNGELAAAITAAGARGLGLAAGTGGVLVAKRRPPQSIDGRTVDFGAVGDLVAIGADTLRALLADGIVPVLSPPAGDGAGGFLNVNADLAAAAIAVALEADKLVIVTSVPGIHTDPDDPASTSSTLTLDELDAHERDGVLAGGMLVKARATRDALRGGVPRVHVVSGIEPDALTEELYTTEGAGTLVTAGVTTEPATLVPGRQARASAVAEGAAS